jgi:hypothetical protein
MNYHGSSQIARGFEVGDVVWKRNFKQSCAADQYCAKLGSQRVKCVVSKKIGHDSYELTDFETGAVVGIYNAKDLST